MADIDYADIDDGIRNTVRVLREHGFDTCDSGDGTKADMECAVSFPMVAAKGACVDFIASDTRRMQAVLDDLRPDYWRVEGSFCALDGTCILLATPRGAEAE